MLGELAERPHDVSFGVWAGVQEERIVLLVLFTGVDCDVFDWKITPVYEHPVLVYWNERFGLDHRVSDTKPYQIAALQIGRGVNRPKVLVIRPQLRTVKRARQLYVKELVDCQVRQGDAVEPMLPGVCNAPHLCWALPELIAVNWVNKGV
jgi:hypothetical protein